MNRLCFDLEFTWTTILATLVILTGLVSIFVLKDAGFASTCVVTGAGLAGVSKVSNTAWDNYHDKKGGERDV
jgi:hypothetical protein